MDYALDHFTMHNTQLFVVQGSQSLFTYQNIGTNTATIQGSNDASTWSDIASLASGASSVKEHSYKYLRCLGDTQVSVNRGEGDNTIGDGSSGGTASYPFVNGKTYNLGERVVLTNGDIVKSTVAVNTHDPNVNMIGWEIDGVGSVFQGKNVHIISGALRNSGTGWEFISDSLHNPINVTSVEVVNNIDLKINFEGTGNKVIYGSVNCDESYSRLGLQVGPSVGVGSLNLRGYLPLEFSVTTDGANAPIINAINEIKSRITPSRSGTKIRINHTGSVLDYPQVTAVSGSPKASPIDVTPTSMNILQETGQTPYYFRIWAASGAWNVNSNMAGMTLTTTNFATNGTITVNLPTAITGNDFNLQSTSDRYKDSRGVIFLPQLNYFDVKFVDTATNAYRTSIPSDGIAETTFQYGINKGGVNTATTLPAGTYNVKRGLIPVYWNEIKSPDSYGGSANLWFTAQMEY